MIDRDALSANEAEWRDAHEENTRVGILLACLIVFLVTSLSVAASVLAAQMTAGWARHLAAGLIVAALMLPAMLVIARTALNRQQHVHDLGKLLEGQLSDAIEKAELEAAQRELQARHQEFASQLTNALEMADGEGEVLAVVERALSRTVPDTPVEMLLADNSHAHLSRMATASPTGEPPGCTVDSPDHCPAARRAQVQRFRDSENLDACPKLRGRAYGPCSAVCMPVSIMGRTVGVIHAAGPPNELVAEETVHDLATLANLAGARIGLLRVMAETQLQAATDSLTGLLNRRSLENAVRALPAGKQACTVVMADLDHFKKLNDTYGHETGDRSLRLFAQTLSNTLREEDLLSRHGGEEFVIVLPGRSAQDAWAVLERVRSELERAIGQSGLPHFTASFGAIPGEAHDDLNDLITRADAALFEAKRTGRDRIVIHSRDGADLTYEGRASTDHDVDEHASSPSMRIVEPSDDEPGARVAGGS
jgi:diguanylate cyclase (GGDEF)-like protein